VRVASEVQTIAGRVLLAGGVILEVAGVTGDELRADRTAVAAASLPTSRGTVALEVRRGGRRTSGVAGEVEPIASGVGGAARMIDEVVGVGADLFPTDRASVAAASRPLSGRAIAGLWGGCPHTQQARDQEESVGELLHRGSPF